MNECLCVDPAVQINLYFLPIQGIFNFKNELLNDTIDVDNIPRIRFTDQESMFIVSGVVSSILGIEPLPI